jgi:CheY-like chemotaxis protein
MGLASFLLYKELYKGVTMAEQETEQSHIPPIVLLVEDENDTRDMYAVSLEMAGFWVATADDPDAAMDTVKELQPHLIVASITFDGRTDGLRFVRAVKAEPATQEIPLVVLSGRPPEDLPRGARDHAVLVLLKPVTPDRLATELRRVLERSRGLRAKSATLSAKTERLLHKSAQLRVRADAINDSLPRARACPTCGARLDWVERGSIGGIEYDYYRWCVNACGLYCYDRTSDKFVRLA